ncbi:MAG: DUF2242 domain-containing protein [Variovorax sp.]
MAAGWLFKVAAISPVLVLVACGSTQRASGVAYRQEGFNSTSTYSRSYPASPARACEAARRALLSQGYVIGAAAAESVKGSKNFQPEPTLHVQVEFRIVCAREGEHASIVFVNALQDRYTIKKSNNSASVGVGGIGSLSLPFASSDDSLVRVGSETVQDAAFYERFFVLLERYLPEPWIEPVPAAPAVAPPSVATPLAQPDKP